MCVLALRGFYNHMSARFPLTTSKIILYVDRVNINFNFNFYFASLLPFLCCFTNSYALYIVSYFVLKSNSFWLNMHIVYFTIHNSFLLRRLSR